MARRVLAVSLVGLAVLLCGLHEVAAGPVRAGASRMMPQAMHASAFAALQPVGEAAGWGRIAVQDADLPSGLNRMVTVWLFGMDPGVEFTVVIDGIEIGTLTTRPSGSAVLKLQTRGRGHDAVPSDLPPADLLALATVLGPSLEPVLEGSFSSFVHDGGKPTYEERIILEDVTGGDAEGIAKVEMQDDGQQEFKTHATGLIPGEIYSVLVDGLTVATVTADGQGQARVELEHPDDDNPLPPELQPVSKIVEVEWWGPGGLLLLSGSFTGLGDCGAVFGTVVETTSDGFILDTEDGQITVMTTDSTTWDDFDDRELVVGDAVKVEGCWDGDTLVASEVELKGEPEPEHDHDCGAVVGTVEEVGEDGFTVRRGPHLIAVATTADTRLENFGDHELSPGDFVKVEGCWDGDTFVAEVVELKREDKLASQR